jgi:hypothetical protein
VRDAFDFEGIIYLHRQRGGDEIPLEVMRGKEIITTKVTLGKQPR